MRKKTLFLSAFERRLIMYSVVHVCVYSIVVSKISQKLKKLRISAKFIAETGYIYCPGNG